MSKAKITLYEYGDTKKPISLGLRAVYAFWNSFQETWIRIELILHSIYAKILARFGVSFYAVILSEEGYKDADALFHHTRAILSQAKEIRISLGEMDYRLMELSPLIDLLEQLSQKNQVTIEILHGLRVDPRTRRPFELAKRDNVRLFRMTEHRRHHFILTTDASGQTSVIDEGTHNETVWVQDGSGNPISTLTSQVRFYYITKNSTSRTRYLQKEYEYRKNNAFPSIENRGISPAKSYFSPKLVAEAMLNVPLKHFIQPVAIGLHLPIDLRLERLYKRITSMVPRQGIEAQPVADQRPSPLAKSIHLSIPTTLEQIPAVDPCEVCGESAQRTLVPYRQPFAYKGEEYIAEADVPGYRCDACELEFYDLDASIEVLEAARKAIQGAGDMQTSKSLAALLKAGKLHRSRFR